MSALSRQIGEKAVIMLNKNNMLGVDPTKLLDSIYSLVTHRSKIFLHRCKTF
jgi:hypothetical protein